jgi:hypothetical protein
MVANVGASTDDPPPRVLDRVLACLEGTALAPTEAEIRAGLAGSSGRRQS